MKRDRWTRRENGWALGKTAKTKTQIAQALEVNKSTVTRWTNGTPGWPSAVDRYTALLEDLTKDPNTDPAPLLVHAQTVVERTLAEMDPERLGIMLDRAMMDETMRQAPGDIAQQQYYRGTAGLLELQDKLIAHVTPAVRAIGIISALRYKSQVKEAA